VLIASVWVLSRLSLTVLNARHNKQSNCSGAIAEKHYRLAIASHLRISRLDLLFLEHSTTIRSSCRKSCDTCSMPVRACLWRFSSVWWGALTISMRNPARTNSTHVSELRLLPACRRRLRQVDRELARDARRRPSPNLNEARPPDRVGLHRHRLFYLEVRVSSRRHSGGL
jgi:hypothetical protein